MRASNSWHQFVTLLDLAFPKRGKNLLLPFMDGVAAGRK